ncbi:MAG: 2-succinylbenzoate--CoA ligase [Chroococcopsis gigantea SAG 12.99]|nr:2-succinylbenzoate--CoA ligase [Chlorogloea purpurea SAG 13.99]MDV3000285.1 2-succinylbenzoate--CoA ligase [Chroococcopsis gigantea SAG 12.99]
MADILTHLKNLTSGDWLHPFPCQKFLNLVQQYEKDFRGAGKPLFIFLTQSDTEQFLAVFLAGISAGCHIFLCNPDWGENEWRQVYSLAKPDFVFGRKPERGEDERVNPILPGPCILIPTGGTSGKIRFAIHTWETLEASVKGFREYYGLKRINSFCILPLYHVSGLMQFVRSFVTGGKFIYFPYGQIKQQIPYYLDVENYFISLVPTQLQYLLRSQPGWLSEFSTVLLGGAPTQRMFLEEARLANIKISLTYGMTETASQIVNLKPEEFLAGNLSNGSVLPHAEVKIYNGESQEVTKGETGVIGIKSPSLFLGYYPALNRLEIFFTDDLGYFDEENCLHIIGRNSQKIITGGENVHPLEIETAIKATNLVQDVAVIGYPDERWGQIVIAFYVPGGEDIKSPQDIEDRLRLQLAKYKVPKLWIVLPIIPTNEAGKINYQQLQSIARTYTAHI